LLPARRRLLVSCRGTPAYACLRLLLVVSAHGILRCYHLSFTPAHVYFLLFIRLGRFPDERDISSGRGPGGGFCGGWDASAPICYACMPVRAYADIFALLRSTSRVTGRDAFLVVQQQAWTVRCSRTTLVRCSPASIYLNCFLRGLFNGLPVPWLPAALLHAFSERLPSYLPLPAAFHSRCLYPARSCGSAAAAFMLPALHYRPAVPPGILLPLRLLRPFTCHYFVA